jgi:urease accessory protein
LRAREGAATGAALFFVLKPDSELEEDWLLWQLADSAFPSGGFAHSAGLEAAWQQGEIGNSAALADFIETNLRQFGHASLPFFNAAHESPEQLAEFDLHCDAFLTNHVANRASRLQGRAFLSSSSRIFQKSGMRQSPCGHFAPIFGVVTQSLELPRFRAAHLFLFQHVRGLIGSAIRLGIVGPMEGQASQHRLTPVAMEILARCDGLTVLDAAQTAPLLEIWQGTQDRLYSRLFQS